MVLGSQHPGPSMAVRGRGMGVNPARTPSLFHPAALSGTRHRAGWTPGLTQHTAAIMFLCTKRAGHLEGA